MPSITRVLLSDARVLAAYVIFAGSYLVFALGKFPWMKIDRPGAAIIGAVLMVAFGIVGGGEALASVDFATVVLLFAMMLIVGSLRLAGFFAWITDWMIERLHPQLAAPELQHGRFRKKPVVVLVVVLAGLLAGVPPPMTAAVGAALLLITRTVEPRRLYDEIDWGLLVFFVGLFIIVGGADRAGLTARLLEPVNAWNLHRIPIFVGSTAVLSNIVSNVPGVMLLRTVVSAFPDPRLGWIALAMASTLAGNLTITGSVANIIVVERAAAEGVHVGSREYLRVGAPLTVATVVVGSLWLWATSP